MNRTNLILVLAITTTLGAVEARATETKNGFYLNTESLNGFYLNSDSLNGFYLNAAALNAATLDGVGLAGLEKGGKDVTDVKVEGSEIFGSVVEPGGCSPAPANSVSCVAFHGSRAVRYRGAWFVGATLEASSLGAKVSSPPMCTQTKIITRDNAAAPKRIPLKITAYEKSGPDALYVVVIDNADPRIGQQYLCGTEVVRSAGGTKTVPVPTIIVPGAYNPFAGERTGGAKVSSAPNVITFACLNGAIGKCAHGLGYRPWETFTSGGKTLSKAGLHQACTRMIRADYCGDGTPRTVAGTLINFADKYGLQAYSPGGNPASEMEAAWDEQGATQLNCARAEVLFPADAGRRSCPSLDRFPQKCWNLPKGLGGVIPPSFAQITNDYPTSLLANTHVAPQCDQGASPLPGLPGSSPRSQ